MLFGAVVCLCVLISNTYGAFHDGLCSKNFQVQSQGCRRPIDDAVFALPGPGTVICLPVGNGVFIVRYPCLSPKLMVSAPGYSHVHTTTSGLGVHSVLLPENYDNVPPISVGVKVSSVCGSDLTGLGLETSPAALRVASTGSGWFQIYSCDSSVSITAFQEDHQSQTVQATPGTASTINLPCKVDGGWSEWLTEPCTRTCGGGFRFRFRSCDNPLPVNGGLPCIGSSRRGDIEPCNTFPCPVDGGWSEWVFTPCTATCGGGTQNRVRQCDSPARANDGVPCEGDAEEVPVPCNEQPCPVDGGFTPWTLWTDCSCNAPQGVAPVQTRTRTCTNPEPAFGGAPCTEPLLDRKGCTLATPCAFCVSACCNGLSYQHIPDERELVRHRVNCEKLGGRLVEVNCAEENTIVVNLLLASGTVNRYSMGMQRIDGVMKWYSEEALTFTDWQNANFPNPNNNCAMWRQAGGVYTWRSFNCAGSLAVCEFQVA